MMLFAKLNYKLREYTQVYSFKTKKKRTKFRKIIEKGKKM